MSTNITATNTNKNGGGPVVRVSVTSSSSSVSSTSSASGDEVKLRHLEEGGGGRKENEEEEMKKPLLINSEGLHHEHQHHEHKHQEITRLEMWTDAIASIAATISLLPLMESLKKEEKGEETTGSAGSGNEEPTSSSQEVYRISVMILIVGIGFLFIGRLMSEQMVFFHWLRKHADSLPVVLLNCLFLSFLSLTTFATQSLVQALVSPEAIVFYSSVMVAVYLSALLLFAYTLYMNEKFRKVLGKYGILLEAGIRISLIVAIVLLSVLQPYLGNYTVMTFSLACSGVVFFGSLLRTETMKKKMLPLGYPKERLAVYTDGVYAIAITLIILDVRFPIDFGKNISARQFIDSEWHAIVAHFVAFVVLGLHWYLHTIIFSKLQDNGTKNDDTTYWLNSSHCSLVAIFPFLIALALKNDVRPATYIIGPIADALSIAILQSLMYLYIQGKLSSKAINYICGALGGTAILLSYVIGYIK